MNPSKQKGIAAVETAIVALLALMVLFAVLEFSRAFFVMNALEEATRRGARVAAVCQVNDPAIARITIFNDSASTGPSPLLPDLSTANIVLDYLSDTGAIVADPIGSFDDIGYVRVSIVNYQHQLLIPMFVRTFTMPSFFTVLPRESLGVTPVGFTTC